MCQLSGPSRWANTDQGQESHLPRKRDSMSKITELASGQITDSDALGVVLAEPDDMPTTVVIHWPTHPTITTPASYDQTAATVMRVLAIAVIALAQIRRDGKRL